MMKKTYIAPCMMELMIKTSGLLAASSLDPLTDTPEVILSEDPSDIVGGEFGAPDFSSDDLF